MRKLFLILMTVIACSWSLVAQTKTIRGTVLDAANNEPLIGATIMPVGGGQGTQADVDGKFTLTVPAKVSKATFSYVGYTSKTVDLKNDMIVYLASSSTDLEDVIVVAYGTANKESLTGSVAVVGAKEIEDRPVTTATAALEGNAPGVQVNNSIGAPGSEPQIRVRGFTSLRNNSPLYVVDGVYFETGINDLNPQDIESISVLKDAASCALYGNKGSNGVVLITTKKAKNKGKVDVNVSFNLGIYNRGLPQYDRLNTNQWMEQVYTGMYNQYITGDAMTPDEIVAYLHNDIISPLNIPVNLYDKPNTEVFDANGKLAGTILPGYDDLDWWKAISRNGFRQEYTVNAAGATDNFNVFASAGYLKEKGYMIGTDFERFNGRINTNFQPNKWLKFGLNLQGTAQHGNNQDNVGDEYDNVSSNPFNVENYSPIYSVYAHNADGSKIIGADGKPEYNTAPSLGGLNMALALRKDLSDFTYYAINAKAYGTLLLPYGFDLTISGNINRSKTQYNIYNNNVTGSTVTMNGTFAQQASDNRFSTFQQMLNWSKDYGYHHVDALLGHENYMYNYEYFYGRKYNQSFDGLYVMSNFTENPSVNGSATANRQESYLSRARYNYMQKYFFEASLRRDGSSIFAKDNRWGNFFSLGASWVITKENFMNNAPWVNFLKLHAAYGTVGNNAAGTPWNYLNTYGLGTYFGQAMVIPTNFASNNLKWETTRSFDLGLEGSMFDDRFGFSLGYYVKQSVDLIFAIRQSASAGCVSNTWSNPTVLSNMGQINNHGWELSFNVDILRLKDFTWNASVDFSFLSNTIKKLPDGNDISNGSQRFSEGHSIYEWYTRHWAGVDMMTGNSVYVLDPNAYQIRYMNDHGQNGKSQFENYLNGAKDNNMLMLDADGNPVVGSNGEYYVYNPDYATYDWRGTALPTVYGSFSTNFSWKGLSLGMMFTYSLGGKVYDSGYSNLLTSISPNSLQSAFHKDVLKSWSGVPEGMTYDSPNRIDNGAFPQFNFANQNRNYGNSDYFLTSGDYLCFKNLNVSYQLPQKWVKALQLQNISLGFAVDNLFTVTARKGLNPQQSFSGVQYKNFMTARVYNFSINAKF